MGRDRLEGEGGIGWGGIGWRVREGLKGARG